MSPRREAWPVTRAMSWRSSRAATGPATIARARLHEACRLVPTAATSGTPDNGQCRATGDHPGVDYQRIGRSLRALRQRRRLTQAELAGAAGVSQSLISL